jgi:chromosome partitioning protein
VARVIAVTNQKGGVGKTTTAINLSASLMMTKRRTLLIDLDPQGNATQGSGIDKNAVEASVCDVLVDQLNIADVAIKSPTGDYDVLPGNGDLTHAEVELLKVMVGREMRLSKALKKVDADYDYIIIDCPPALNMLTVNALSAADSVLVPMQCEYFALEGLAALTDTIEQIREHINDELEIEGILRTMYDPRTSLAKQVSDELTKHFGDKVFRTMIPRNIRLAEAPSHGMPAIVYDKTSKGALAYLALVGEMIRRNENVDVEVS